MSSNAKNKPTAKPAKSAKEDAGWTTVAPAKKGSSGSKSRHAEDDVVAKLTKPDPQTLQLTAGLYDLLAEKDTKPRAKDPSAASKDLATAKKETGDQEKEAKGGKGSQKTGQKSVAPKQSAPVVPALPTIASLAALVDKAFVDGLVANLVAKYPGNLATQTQIFCESLDEHFSKSKVILDMSNISANSEILFSSFSKSGQDALTSWIRGISEVDFAKCFLSALEILSALLSKTYQYKISGFGVFVFVLFSITKRSSMITLGTLGAFWDKLNKYCDNPKFVFFLLRVCMTENVSNISALWCRFLVPMLFEKRTKEVFSQEIISFGALILPALPSLTKVEKPDEIVPDHLIRKLFDLYFARSSGSSNLTVIQNTLADYYNPLLDFYTKHQGERLFDFYLEKAASEDESLRAEALKNLFVFVQTPRGRSAWTELYPKFVPQSYNLLLHLTKNLSELLTKATASDVETLMRKFLVLNKAFEAGPVSIKSKSGKLTEYTVPHETLTLSTAAIEVSIDEIRYTDSSM
eukprot:TRINITY_DN4184_c0_g1_i2.p1 TRINITY_DN4184_c0_g1~~TRINITY_DN4184_c0_g1_i2.p1  ORF type:complete len:521 (-),score=136.41 TRINITY_DN4184_c0_g1_i2:43-1605(-)